MVAGLKRSSMAREESFNCLGLAAPRQFSHEMGVKPQHSFETSHSCAALQVWGVEGMGCRAVSGEEDIAQPRSRHQLFEIFPSSVPCRG